jgi:hypothetical protein
MEADDDAKVKLVFDLPTSGMESDSFEVFKKFYSIYPHFSRVKL